MDKQRKYDDSYAVY
jgi:Retroviral aspartyl protease